MRHKSHKYTHTLFSATHACVVKTLLTHMICRKNNSNSNQNKRNFCEAMKWFSLQMCIATRTHILHSNNDYEWFENVVQSFRRLLVLTFILILIYIHILALSINISCIYAQAQPHTTNNSNTSHTCVCANVWIVHAYIPIEKRESENCVEKQGVK